MLNFYCLSSTAEDPSAWLIEMPERGPRSSAAEFGEQVCGMDGLGEDLELVALVPRLLQQAGCGGLAAEEQHLALW